jgi:hypothetical protein
MTNEKTQDDKSLIHWHTAFFEAVRMELEQYHHILDFRHEYPLTSEPLRIDLLIIKKLKDIPIEKNIAAFFRTDNLLEYKSPGDYLSVGDFYKVYGCACLYASLNKVPINSLTLSFVESRYPRKILKHLKGERAYQVEERVSGIYTVEGDIIPIQIIDSRRLSGEDNLWLKNLGGSLDIPEIQRITAEIERRGKAVQMKAYLNVIYRANSGKVEEAFNMSRGAKTLEQVLEDVGLTAKWEARGGQEKACEIARKALAKGATDDFVREITGLDTETIRELSRN